MGRLGVAVGFAMAVAIYTAQVFVSRLWLRGHRFGPLEWLSLTYGSRQGWRNGRAGGAIVAAGLPVAGHPAASRGQNAQLRGHWALRVSSRTASAAGRSTARAMSGGAVRPCPSR
jgi:Protein of unknown function (DUF418)